MTPVLARGRLAAGGSPPEPPAAHGKTEARSSHSPCVHLIHSIYDPSTTNAPASKPNGGGSHGNPVGRHPKPRHREHGLLKRRHLKRRSKEDSATRLDSAIVADRPTAGARSGAVLHSSGRNPPGLAARPERDPCGAPRAATSAPRGSSSSTSPRRLVNDSLRRRRLRRGRSPTAPTLTADTERPFAEENIPRPTPRGSRETH